MNHFVDCFEHLPPKVHVPDCEHVSIAMLATSSFDAASH